MPKMPNSFPGLILVMIHGAKQAAHQRTKPIKRDQKGSNFGAAHALAL